MTNEMAVDLDVLSLFMKDAIGCNLNATWLSQKRMAGEVAGT